MQEPESIDPATIPSQESIEAERLRAELVRLKDKRAQTEDPDIASVLDMRITELEASLTTGAEDEPEPEESEEIKKLRTQVAKLQEKLAKTKDKNIISVLQLSIAQIETTLPPPPKPKAVPKIDKKKLEEEEEAAFASIPLPTREQTEQAEKLIRQARLEKQRGNAIGATDLLKKAVEAAPGSAVVLEALGDDLVERKLTKQARDIYKRASKLDPKNVGLERKYAEIVLKGAPAMSVEDMIRYGDSIFLTGSDNVAGLLAAKCLSALIPGCGQLVIGRTTKGAILLGAWIVCVGLFALWNKDFLVLSKYLRGVGPSPNIRVVIPIIAGASVWITAMADLFSGQTKEVARHTKVERPLPPTEGGDLPFE
jgi:hypothetical protein